MTNPIRQGTSGGPETAIVVGAGLIGAATAYFLAREGVTVTLVERDTPGRGASGRSTGYISTITRSAGAQLGLANLSRSLYLELTEQIGNFDLRAAGALVYFDDAQDPLIDNFVARRGADGVPVVGPIDQVDGLFVGAGHAYGVTVGAGSAKVLVDQILGKRPAIDITPFRYDRPAITQPTASAVLYP